jgi:putative chitinase
MGNGDEASGDGYNYRGRGYIQLTGKDNYKAFATFIGDDVIANPDLVATKYPLTSAGFFFNKNKLWAICDKGETVEVITELTKRINGGTHGLDDRIAKFRLYQSLI